MFYLWIEFLNGSTDKIYLSTDRAESERTWENLEKFMVNGESGLFEIRHQIIRTTQIQNVKLMFDENIVGDKEYV